MFLKCIKFSLAIGRDDSGVNSIPGPMSAILKTNSVFVKIHPLNVVDPLQVSQHEMIGVNGLAGCCERRQNEAEEE